MSSERRKVPKRRASVTYTREVGALHLHMTVGFYTDGRPCEVFISGVKAGAQTELMCNDIAVLTSLLLQHGLTPDQIGHSLGCEKDSVCQVAVDILRKHWPKEETE